MRYHDRKYSVVPAKWVANGMNTVYSNKVSYSRFKCVFVRISYGKEFHNFDAEWEKERSYSTERDLGMHKSPFSDDLKERECFSDKGVNKLEMHVGVKLFRAFVT